MSIRTETKLLEFGKWWEYNSKGTDNDGNYQMKLPEDMGKRTEMLAQAIDALSHIYIDIVEDIRVLEGRGTIGRNMNKIITPDNVLGRN